MSAVAAAIGVSAAAGIAGSIIGGNAQADAANAAAKSQMNANQTNYKEYEESRGSQGSAVLPMYLQNPGGGTFEGQLGKDLVGAYGNTAVPLSNFENATAPLAPAQQAAGQFTNDIFNGGITSKLQAEAAPGQALRLSTARQSALEGLNKSLAAIDAAQAGKGFSGDSYGNRLLRFQANQTAGNQMGAAAGANAAETQQIQNFGNATLPSQNLTLPYSMATQAGNFSFLPQANYLQSMNERMAPLGFLKMGPGNPPPVQPLPVSAGLRGGAIAAGIGSATGSIGNMALMNGLLGNGGGGGWGGGSSGGGYVSPVSYDAATYGAGTSGALIPPTQQSQIMGEMNGTSPLM